MRPGALSYVLRTSAQHHDRVCSGMSPLPRFDLIKTVVAAPPRPPTRNPPDDNDIAVDGDGTSSDGQDEPQLEYITHLERSCDGGQVATALSSLKVNLYSSDTMLANGQLSGHTGPLTQLAFAPSDSHALFSASEDGTVRGWDVRSLSSTATFGQSGEEVWSMALGYDGHLCATGKGCTVEFYDLRKTGKPLGMYSECHSDAVTQVRFHPHKRSFMLTGSEDGLMCFFDTGVSTEEDALDSVMNAECAVRSVGFFGPEGEGVYCCSNTETLSLWHASGAQRIKDFGDVRALARPTPSGDATAAGGHGTESRGGWGAHVDCIVGCQYEAQTDRLRLVTSGFDGGACVATISPEGITPEAVLEGGHSEQIRTFDWRGQTVFTGAEDAKVCLWRVPGGSDSGDGLKRRRENDDAMDEDDSGSEEEQINSGSSPMSAGAGRHAENRAGKTPRPGDVDGRRR